VPTLELFVLLLLLTANGVPILVHLVLGERWGWPLDGGWQFIDGQPLLGASKTVVGVVGALLASTLLALFLDLGWRIGLLIGGVAMLGDLLSSFFKRRMGLRPSAMALGLDQVPESLLPLMACAPLLDLTWTQVLLLTLVFVVLEIILSRVAYYFGIRKQPY